MSEQDVVQQQELAASLWVMDSDICDECGGLMGDWGFCESCGWDGVDYDEEEDEDTGLIWYRPPKGKQSGVDTLPDTC